MRRTVLVLAFAAVSLVLAWHLRLHEEVLARLRPAGSSAPAGSSSSTSARPRTTGPRSSASRGSFSRRSPRRRAASSGTRRPARSSRREPVTAQTLFEEGRLDGPGRLQVAVEALREEHVRRSLEESYLAGATGRSDVFLVVGKKDEGDAENRLWEIDFPLSGHATRLEAQGALLRTLFGAADAVTSVRHDAELLEASRNAKERFPRLAALARKGFAPGQRLLLKAPFKSASGGNEWMWVEVVTWKGDLVSGVLQNDPYAVPGIEAGARVEFRASEAFDYILYHPDGRKEGNRTGALIQRQSGHPPDTMEK